MKVQIMNAVLFLSLSQFSFAASAPKPANCPSVAALQAVGVIEMINEDELWYGAVKSSNYGTEDKWTFAIGAFRATDENDAKQKALHALNALTLQSGPIAFNIDGQDSWICSYTDGEGHSAGSITPAMFDDLRSWIIRH